MHLLVDQEITAALQNPAGDALAYVIGGDPPQPQLVGVSQVRSTSLDLTIGDIFVPDSKEADLGGTNNGKSEHNLGQGHTAVIRTLERLRMGQRRAAISFPPSRVSLRGLLMTNPGHIDPGYEGSLHCTVINMGREDYQLRRRDRIMRVLFFALDDKTQEIPVSGGLPVGRQITTELLARLSIDFLDVERRAQTIANSAVSQATTRATLISASIPLGVAVLGILATLYLAPVQGVKDDIVKLRSDLSKAATKLEERDDVHTLARDLATLKVQITKNDRIDERLKALEAKLSALSSNSQGRTGQ